MGDNQFFDKSNEPEKSSKWYHGILVVLIALFALGPFAFPLLWKSPNFSSLMKIIITVLVTAATIAMIGGTWTLVQMVIDELKKAGMM